MNYKSFLFVMLLGWGSVQAKPAKEICAGLADMDSVCSEEKKQFAEDLMVSERENLVNLCYWNQRNWRVLYEKLIPLYKKMLPNLKALNEISSKGFEGLMKELKADPDFDGGPAHTFIFSAGKKMPQEIAEMFTYYTEEIERMESDLPAVRVREQDERRKMGHGPQSESDYLKLLGERGKACRAEFAPIKAKLREKLDTCIQEFVQACVSEQKQ